MKQLFAVGFNSAPPKENDRYYDEISFYVVAESLAEAMDKANNHFKSIVVPKSLKELKAERKKKDFDSSQFPDLAKYVLTKIELEHTEVIL